LDWELSAWTTCYYFSVNNLRARIKSKVFMAVMPGRATVPAENPFVMFLSLAFPWPPIRTNTCYG
jgi:hypothetical protein